MLEMCKLEFYVQFVASKLRLVPKFLKRKKKTLKFYLLLYIPMYLNTFGKFVFKHFYLFVRCVNIYYLFRCFLIIIIIILYITFMIK